MKEKEEPTNANDEPMDDDKNPEEEDANKEEEDNNEESEVSQKKHVMFDTDNYQSCLQTAVWFGKKIPPRRRLYGRGAANAKSDLASEIGTS